MPLRSGCIPTVPKPCRGAGQNANRFKIEWPQNMFRQLMRAWLVASWQTAAMRTKNSFAAPLISGCFLHITSKTRANSILGFVRFTFQFCDKEFDGYFDFLQAELWWVIEKVHPHLDITTG